MRKEEASFDYIKLFEEESDTNVKPLKLLYHLYKEHLLKIVISFFFYIIKSSPVWVLPMITANVINIATNPKEHKLSELWIQLMIILIVVLQNIPMHIIHVAFFSKALRQVEAGLRSTLVRKLQQLSIGFYGHLGTGRIQAKVLRDVEAIEMLSRQLMLSLMPAIVNLTIAIVLTMMHSMKIAYFYIIMIPTSMLIVSIFRKKIKKTNRDFRENIEEMSGQVSEMVEMIPVTRAHALEDLEIKKMESRLQDIKQKGYRLDILESYFASSNWVVFQLFQILCLFFTVYLAYKGKMPVGDVVMYQGYFTLILGAVTGILNVYPIIAKGFESLYSVTEILLSNDTEPFKGRKFPEPFEGNITFKDVSFKYEDSERHALKSFSLDVKAGETIAFVGESGSGKSTILNLIIGFYKAQEGTILIDGVPINEIDIKKYRKLLAIVLQDTILFSGTIRDNITYGLPKVREEKLQQVIKMANLEEVIQNLPEGLDTQVGEGGAKLSGGQKQRIAIARALIRDPKIIILDEATSALDNKSERFVQQALEQLTKNRTTFIVAHRLSTISHADRIVVLKNGSIVEIGSYDELMAKKGMFYQLQQA
ncbi:ATP-binding cassette subfamily B protein [Anoxybacillus tepidamans]|uniref:ATP-binding cassette subfamily B protein n=1 Tax=Anoxybacteroides tepidamans TaxID=265948 RepID=A0A7W8ISA9_9BACL|nr:ABC transporter ATP-binding protein [Anoxybacillus tepidamans]MBB5325729.1 ATP-binding cassette subfamily B protein [Anoxybacillus tepidamans]